MLSGSPLGLADVMAKGPVTLTRYERTELSGTRIATLSFVPTKSAVSPTPRFCSQGPFLTTQVMPPG